MRSSSRAGGASKTPARLIELFPDTAAVEDGELVVGGLRASALAEEFGTPLVVYCRDTLLACARAYARVDPEALVVYGTKAFPNVALLRLFAAEGLGADVSTRGKLGLAPEDTIEAIRAAQEKGLEIAGLHVHIGSQLTRLDESLLAVDRMVELASRCKQELGWSPRVFDLGGGLGVRQTLEETIPEPETCARALVQRLREQ